MNHFDNKRHFRNLDVSDYSFPSLLYDTYLEDDSQTFT